MIECKEPSCPGLKGSGNNYCVLHNKTMAKVKAENTRKGQSTVPDVQRATNKRSVKQKRNKVKASGD